MAPLTSPGFGVQHAEKSELLLAETCSQALDPASCTSNSRSQAVPHGVLVVPLAWPSGLCLKSPFLGRCDGCSSSFSLWQKANPGCGQSRLWLLSVEQAGDQTDRIKSASPGGIDVMAHERGQAS